MDREQLLASYTSGKKRQAVNDLMQQGQQAVEELIIQSTKIEAFNFSILATDLLKNDIRKQNNLNSTKLELSHRIELRKKITD